MIIMLGIDKSVTQLVGKEHAHHIDGKKLMDIQPDFKGDNYQGLRGVIGSQGGEITVKTDRKVICVVRCAPK